MALFKFLRGLQVSRMANFWQLKNHDIPALPGVYLLVAKPSVHFIYPAGKSPVYYIGHTQSLRSRLLNHLKWHSEVRKGKRSTYYLCEPRHEYGGKYGGRYCYIRTWQGCTSKALEDIVLARFAKRYHSFPVANSAGAWNRIQKEFEID